VIVCLSLDEPGNFDIEIEERKKQNMSVSKIAIELQPTRLSRQPRKKNELLQPFLKWAGGKRQLLPLIREHLPRHFKVYFEPFVGAGALLFDLQPATASINDANPELVNCYRVIKTQPEALIEHIKQHQNTSDYFYSLRDLDREPQFHELPPLVRASRIIYLNKTCYNGLFRVNRQGQFNVPFGDYKNPTIIDAVVIKAISQYLNDNNIQITSEDFSDALNDAGKGDFVYLDPPYDPVSDTASFTGYNLNRFGKEEQVRLKETYDELTRRKCKVMLSNSATKFIYDLYSTSYTILEVEANRNINSMATGRGKVNEFLILNYDVS
jgi:DNA adenine methylase